MSEAKTENLIGDSASDKPIRSMRNCDEIAFEMIAPHRANRIKTRLVSGSHHTVRGRE
jgi:hypothetical protein